THTSSSLVPEMAKKFSPSNCTTLTPPAPSTALSFAFASMTTLASGAVRASGTAPSRPGALGSLLVSPPHPATSANNAAILLVRIDSRLDYLAEPRIANASRAPPRAVNAPATTLTSSGCVLLGAGDGLTLRSADHGARRESVQLDKLDFVEILIVRDL